MKTIPENPKPGERYAFRRDTGAWQVAVCGEEKSIVGIVFAEADARQLVFGSAAVVALRAIVAADRVGELGRYELEIGDNALDGFPETV